MDYAGSLKKKDGKPSKNKAGPTKQAGPKERSSKDILSIIRPSEKRTRNVLPYQNEASRTISPTALKLERNFPRKGIVLHESAEEKKKRLLKIIETHESPFNENSSALAGETSIFKLQEKIKEVQEERVGLFKWRNFCLNLTLSVEQYRASDLESSLKTIEQLEKTILKIFSSNVTNYFFMGMFQALYHVVTVSKAFLLVQMGKLVEAEKVLPNIEPLERMRRSARAGMFGIRAAIFMEYGLEGNRKALEQLSEAIEKDKSTAEWFFLKGKCMARIRRLVEWNNLVTYEEVDALSIATRRDKENAVYLIYLAQSLRDKAFRDMKYLPEPVFNTVYSKGEMKKIKVDKEKNEKFIKVMYAAYYKMMEAVEKSPDNVRILIRAASIMVKMPFRMANLKLATEWLDKAMEKAPNNSVAHHVRGILLERFDVEPEKALTELRIAEKLGNYAAALGIVRITFNLGHKNIVEQFDHLATVFNDSYRLQNTYSQAGSYLLFIKKDIVSAAAYFVKVIDLNAKSYQMMCHKSMFLRMEQPVDLFNVLQSELSENVLWATFSKEDRKVLKTLSIKMYVSDDEVKTKKLFITDVIDKSIQLFGRDRKARAKKPRKKFVWKGTIKKTEMGGKLNEKTQVDGKFSLNDWNKSLLDSNLTSDGMSMADKFNIQSQQSSLQRYPSDSSISSSCSDVSYKSKYHESRKTESPKENLQELESQFVNLPRRTGFMPEFDYASISDRDGFDKTASSDNDSGLDTGKTMMELRRSSTSSGRSSASVMDRVKQSYLMLDYKKSAQPEQSKKKQTKLNRTDSTQSLHTDQEELRSSGLRQRSDSIQSLDSIEKKFKPTFTPSLSSRSFTFMPNFSKQ